MTELPHILLLDDDEIHVEHLSEALERWGYRVTACLNVEAAERALDGIDLAIVDLFLAGNEGEELSNGFVLQRLVPRGIPYIRLSSAPGLVPKNCAGCGVYDKRSFRREPERFRDSLNRLFESLRQT
jgi:DNA-binding NtrC family response regulator